jgi:hypothetical protein
MPGFKASTAYVKICPPCTETRWQRFNWINFVPKRVQIFFWIMRHGNTRTHHFLHASGMLDTTYYPSCASEREDIDHLFGACPAVADIWVAFLPAGPVITSVDNVCQPCSSAFQAWEPPVLNTLLLTMLWTVWKRRNRKVFNDITMSVPATTSLLSEHIRLWLVRAKPSTNTRSIEDWRSFVIDVIR